MRAPLVMESIELEGVRLRVRVLGVVAEQE